MLACPASFFKKDSRQAGMTDNVVLLMNSLLIEILRLGVERSMDLINFTPCDLCRSSLFLSFWLVQNLSCDPEQSEGFSPRRVAEVTRQAGMTLKTNIQFLTPAVSAAGFFTMIGTFKEVKTFKQKKGGSQRPAFYN